MENLKSSINIYTIGGYLEKIASIVDRYYSGKPLDSKSRACNILGLAKHYIYGDIFWDGLVGDVESDLVKYLEKNEPILASILQKKIKFIDNVGNSIDFQHLCGSLDGYLRGRTVHKEFFGWKGDIISVTKKVLNYTNNSNDYDYLISASKLWIGHPNGPFSNPDINSDIDCDNIFRELEKNSYDVVKVIKNYYYNNRSYSRFSIFITNLGGDEAFYTIMEGPINELYPLLGCPVPTAIQKGAICGTFADFVFLRRDSSIT